MTTYTVGIWTVKPGREEDFVATWQAMSERTLAEFPNAHGTLLRHRDQQNRFVSFGPWESDEQVVAWRQSAAFKEGVARMQDMLEDFVPGTYDLVLDSAQTEQ